jgi:hypothetical protein
MTTPIPGAGSNGNGHAAANPTLGERMKDKVAENPYGMLAAAFAIGYVAGGGLFTKTTARMVQMGARLTMIPQVREPLLDMAEAAIDGMLENTKPKGP